MTDRELMELAAKAIGLTLRYNYLGGRDANQPWDPLDDDGDALRLAVKLGMTVQVMDSCTLCESTEVRYEMVAQHGADAYEATRRAIVRAAAAIGSAM